MELLRKIFFFVPYPAAIFWHVILGGIVAALIGVVAFGYDGHGHVWLPITGAIVAVIIGALLVRR